MRDNVKDTSFANLDSVKDKEKNDSSEAMSKKNQKSPKFKPDIKNLIILLFDYAFIILAYIISIMSISEINIEYVSLTYLIEIIRITPYYGLLVIVIFFVFKLYVNDLKPVSMLALEKLIISNFISAFA
ncbi:MAG: hypothetical protein K6E10_05430, partial [Eubacterium sp.]|nr:hypothetical protein [Eubacterium sp.]